MSITLTLPKANCRYNIIVNSAVCYAYGSKFLYLSAMGNAKDIRLLEQTLKHRERIKIGSYVFSGKDLNDIQIKTQRIPGYHYTQLIAYKKDDVDPNNNIVTAYIYYTNADEEYTRERYDLSINNILAEYPAVIDDVYNKINQITAIPILREWMPYIIDSIGSNIIEEYRSSYSCDMPSCVVEVTVNKNLLIDTISTGLKEGKIFIKEGATVSEKIKESDRLDVYLNNFAVKLASKIDTNFAPLFTPSKDTYGDQLKDIKEYNSYMGQLDLYDAQKAVIEAIDRCLNKNKRTLLVGEMGVGKTILSLDSVLVNNKKNKALTNIVMCPGHLVDKWRREIETRIPMSKACIVNSFSDILELLPEIKNKKRKTHLWIVISKDTAKFSYDERPAVIWKYSRKHRMHMYHCPECGKPITIVNSKKIGEEIADELSFVKKNDKNSYCKNTIKKFNPLTQEYESHVCNAKLWTAANKEDTNCKWINGGSSIGWFEKDKATRIIDLLRSNSTSFPKNKKSAAIRTLQEFVYNDEILNRMPRRYSIARFIKNYCKHYIDYFIADEVHELKAKNSAQGQAFGDILQTANKAICLTGTLLNGYASGIYYTLFRLFPNKMREEGFTYDGSGETLFTIQYGVMKQIREQKKNEEGKISQIKNQYKEMPGISPLVFTKFLLENTVFISQEDISDGMPGYEEIPIGIDMDSSLSNAYFSVESSASRYIGAYKGKTMAQALQLLSIYPDQPYNLDPIIDTGKQEVLYTPLELQLDDNALLPKEEKLVEIIKAKKEAGEKVLVYYHWVNKTQLGERLTSILEKEGIKTTVLTNSVKAANREEWINKALDKDIDVLICNPSLVETGLDLLAFTTIIFYQTGYNLFTMRQASRRSWRLSQDKDVQVYFLYYKNTVQEIILSLMATKLEAAMSLEGKFSEEGLNALSNNEDILTQIASSVTDNIKNNVDVNIFTKNSIKKNSKKTADVIVRNIDKKRIHPYKTLSDSISIKIKKAEQKRKIEVMHALPKVLAYNSLY